MKEITESPTFVCHKTVQGRKKDRLQCAGHMLLMQYDNQFFRLAKRLNLPLYLSGEELVFETPEACIEHHK